MLPTDDRDWIDDMHVRLPEREITGYVSAVEDTVLFSGSKVTSAAFLTMAGVAGSVFGGLLVSGALWSSWWAMLAYFTGMPAIWWAIRLMSLRLLGPAMKLQALSLFFFTFLMGAAAILGAGLTSRWSAYGVSVGGGALFGLVYGSLDPTAIRVKEIWAVGMPLGPVSTFAATYLQRHSFDGWTLTDTALSAAIGGAIFSAPMMLLLVLLWDNSRGLRQIGVLYLHNDALLPKSIDYLTRALELSPDDGELLSLRGIAKSRTGDTAGAEADWQRVLELDEKSAEPARNRADALLRTGAVAEAVAALEQAAEAAPRHGPTHASLAIALSASGDFANAIKHADRALQLDPRRPSTYACRAHALLAQGAFKRVIKDCDDALSLNFSYALPYLIRGRAYLKLGNPERATEDFEEALNAAPDEQTAAEARRELGDLEE